MLTLEEILEFYDDQYEMKITQMFESADKKHQGYITKEQFNQIKQKLRDLKQQKKQAAVEQNDSFCKTDTDKDGLVSLEDVLEHYEGEYEKQITYLFTKLDPAHEGYLNKQKYEQLSKQLKQQIASAKPDAAPQDDDYANIDTNRDGLLSLEEILEFYDDR